MRGLAVLRAALAAGLCCAGLAAQAGVPTSLPYGLTALGNVTEGTSSSPVTITDWGTLDLSGTLNLTGPANISGLLGLQSMPLINNQRLWPVYNVAECSVTINNSAATNTARIGNCLSALPTLGGTLQFGAGTYQFSAPIISSTGPVNFVGTGEFASTLQITASGGAHLIELTYTGNGGSASNLNLTNTAISPAPTTGCAVYMANGSNLSAHDLIVKQFYGGAVCKSNVGYTYVYNIQVSNYFNTGFYTNGEVLGIVYGNTCQQTNSYVGTGLACYQVVNSQGFRMWGGTNQASVHNVLLNPGAGQSIGTAYMENLNNDYNQGEGLTLDTTGGGVMFSVHVVNSAFPFGTIGVHVKGGCGSVTTGGVTTTGYPTIMHLELDDVNVNRNLEWGELFEGCWDDVQINGGQVMSNNQAAGSTTYPAIEVENAGAMAGTGTFSIAGTAIGAYENPFYTGFTNVPSYAGNPQSGLLLGANYSGTASIDHIIARGNAQFDFNDLSSGTVRIAGDVGAIANGSRLPCETGTASIPVGSLSVAVTYKTGSNSANPLSAAPTRISLAASAPVAVGAGTPGTSAMTLSTAAAVTGSPLTIWWLAGVDGKSSCFN